MFTCPNFYVLLNFFKKRFKFLFLFFLFVFIHYSGHTIEMLFHLLQLWSLRTSGEKFLLLLEERKELPEWSTLAIFKMLLFHRSSKWMFFFHDLKMNLNSTDWVSLQIFMDRIPLSASLIYLKFIITKDLTKYIYFDYFNTSSH